jgi:anti-anti-sigma factor
MELLKITFQDGSPPVLHVQGELDMATAGQLRSALVDRLSTDSKFVLDLGGVTFVDASGLRAILETADSLNGRAPLAIVNGSLLARLLDIVGLREIPSIALRNEA